MRNQHAIRTLTLFLMMGVYSIPAAYATDSRHSHRESRHPSTSSHDTINTQVAGVACKVNISAREDREIVILKLQQRMDCLEVKINELQSEVTMLRAK